MERVWILGVLVMGCYDRSFVDCTVACSAASGCPDGLSCGDERLCRVAGAATACTEVAGTWRLTVERAGSGGQIVSEPAGIDCGATCAHEFAVGAVVTLTATPAPGATFAGWSGACAGQEACVVGGPGDTAVAAMFAGCPSGTQTFVYTGGPETLSLPPCVATISVDASGASGASASDGSPTGTGGRGGRTQAVVPVQPGDRFTVYVGGRGQARIGGFNGGANGATNGTNAGGGGGGATDLRRNGTALVDRIVVAGGGGGAAACPSPHNGGDGGGLVGGAPPSSCGVPNTIASGGTQVAGGRGGAYVGYCIALDGLLGAGSNACNSGGGGGGGGYYGGGGGVWHGGGGGSSFATAGASTVTHDQGAVLGNGQLVVSW